MPPRYSTRDTAEIAAGRDWSRLGEEAATVAEVRRGAAQGLRL